MLRFTAEEALFPPIKLPPVDLPTEDGVPLESNWHRIQINLLIDSIHSLWRSRSDYFAGGNMFILGAKKELYERTFRVPEYFCYDPASQTLWGWRLIGGSYVPIPADQEGALWSEQMELWLGRWQGEYLRIDTTWLRHWTPDGDLVLTLAEAEAQRADAAEAEGARLRARLASLNAANGDDQGKE
jgi:Uma2 family endonuclease